MSPQPHLRASSRLLTGLAVLLVLALVPVLPASPQTEGLRITQVGIKMFGDTVQLAVVATGPLTYKTLQLSSPPRLVIDVPGALVDASVPNLIDVDRGGVARVRVGQFQTNPAIARIAVDMVAPVPFTVQTETPAVLVAKFAPRPAAAAPVVATPASAPAAPPAAGPAAPPVPPAPPVRAAPAPAAQPTPVPGVGPDRITLEFRATEIADVLTAFSKACNVNIVTDPAVRGTITVRLVDLSCEESLRFILEANNLGFRRLGRNLIIVPAERLAPPPEEPEIVVYSLDFATANQSVVQVIVQAVPGIRAQFDARTNQLVIIATQAQHEQIRRVLAGLDIQLVSHDVETRVVDISVSDLREQGFTWGFSTTATGDQGVFEIRGTFPGQVTLGIGDFAWLARLNALVSSGKARVITAPRIAVIDGNEAEVVLSEDIPIPQTDATGRTTFEFKPIGPRLKITPKVNRDGLITVRVEVEVSTVTRLIQSGGFQVPIIAARKATTIVTIRNGESIVIGGLIGAEERRRTVKVPILGDIPLIGFLFRSVTVDRLETELIFVVTPKLVPAQGSGGSAPAPVPAQGSGGPVPAPVPASSPAPGS
jgi:type IV pilus assembly protein PilQ